MNKSHRAALFVFVLLLAALIAAPVLYFAYGDREETAIPLLAGCTLAAMLFVLAAARLTMAFRRSRKLTAAGLPPNRLLHLLDLRQWLLLTVGLTLVAIGTGAVTSVGILATNPAPAAEQQTAAPTTEPVPPITETVTEAPSLSPSEPESPSPSDPASGEDGEPVPGSTKWLDAEDALEGGYDAAPVTFSDERYSRGLSVYCTSAADSVVQWNVAGTAEFHATAGIDDTTRNAFGEVVEFIFYDQDGRELLPEPTEVSAGHPKEISFRLTGVTSLRMTCASRDAKTGEEASTTAALGDPIVVTG